MRAVVRGWQWSCRSPATLAELAEQANPVIRGWWNYYGAFYRRAMRGLFRYIDRRLQRWARRKYKTLVRRKQRSVQWLRTMKEVEPWRFIHWGLAAGTAG
ncbi:Group II intron, maturase-specific domain [compost metagenome]